MRRLIVIGTKGNELGEVQAEILNNKFDELNLIGEVEKIPLEIQGTDNYFNNICGELEKGRIDVAVINMPELPAILPEGIVIGALSQRSDPADSILINENVIDESSILSLKPGARVAVPGERVKNLLIELIPDIHTVLVEGDIYKRIMLIRSKEIDASIESAALVNWLGMGLENIIQIRLNPKEFVPLPAQGVAAYVCREKDIEIRKILSGIHCKTAAKQTNIERKVLKDIDISMQKSLGVFCETDKGSNYHTYAVLSENPASIKRAFVSQSTTYNLPEKIIEQLTK
ncbi:MAG: hypothetical protein HKN67_07415 [Saprospiraceae bacterium]|nr:hypothetical protein [Saprospiraceae bacterium]